MSPLLTIFILGPDALKGNHCKHIVSKTRPRINWTSNADWHRISSYSSSWKVVRTNIDPLFLYWAIFASFASSSTLYALVSKVSVKAFQERNALTITRMQGPPLEWTRWDLPQCAWYLRVSGRQSRRLARLELAVVSSGAVCCKSISL